MKEYNTDFYEEINKEVVVEKCEFFSKIGFWPRKRNLNPESWLKNFKNDSDQYLALYLLDFFQYYSEEICNRLFIDAFVGIAQFYFMTEDRHLNKNLGKEWDDFLKNVYFTHVKSEHPHSADSGYVYARMARQVLNFPASRIIQNEKALELSLKGYPIVFVDDFVGSGQQFITSWKRNLEIKKSFGNFTSPSSVDKVFYCPLVATKYGLDRVYEECSNVKVSAAHILDDSYNILSDSSNAWPDSKREAGIEMVKRVCEDNKINSSGFHGLSLAFAFYNSVPDATHPIFWQKGEKWEPLIRIQ